jgi:hypothetical protein
MKRFFTTFLLLVGVSFSLVISDNHFKVNKKQYTAETPVGIEKSIDLTEADIYHSKRNASQVSLAN